MAADDLSGNRLMLVLLFLVSMVSVVAVIVAAVSLTSSGSATPDINVNGGPQAASTSAGGGSNVPIVINSAPAASPSSSKKRIFKLRLGHQYGGHNYLDEQGYIQGFIKDFTLAVCEMGGMDCRLIWDKPVNCWNSEAGTHGNGGQGLFSGWYDACSGYIGTVSRVQVFDFSLPFMKPPAYYFWIDGTAAASSFDPADISGKTIGFMDGWSGDEKCVARQTSIKGASLPVENIKHFAERTEALQAVRNGEIHALFGSTTGFAEYDGQELKKAGNVDLVCAITGYGMMTTKDNDFNTYWNAAFQKFRDSGKFRKMCEEAKETHGKVGTLNVCVDAP